VFDLVKSSLVVAVVVIPITAISVILGVYLSSIPTATGTGSKSTTVTTSGGPSYTSSSSPSQNSSHVASTNNFDTTLTNSQYILSPPYQRVTTYALNRTWEFSVYLYFDQNNLDLNSTLTYLSPQTEEFELQSPINTLQVFAPNGTDVWNWIVPGAIRLVNVTQNEEFTDFNQIPVGLVMNAVGNYTITILPLVSYSNGTSFGQLLEVNATVAGSYQTSTGVVTTTEESS
jgi:hypothetical protein